MFCKVRPWIQCKERLAALKNLPPVMVLLWGAAPAAVAAEIVFRITVALLPVAALWIGKLIIDLVVSATRSSVAHPAMSGQLWLLVAAEFAVAALGLILGRAI